VDRGHIPFSRMLADHLDLKHRRERLLNVASRYADAELTDIANNPQSVRENLRLIVAELVKYEA
jgi:hypothetical protein